MTNDIKEILDDIEEISLYSTARGLVRELDSKDCKLLLDYITNLQEENERLTNARYSLDRIELEKRIDKAVEYINKYEYQKYCPEPYEKDKYIMREEKEGQDLLNILRGDE